MQGLCFQGHGHGRYCPASSGGIAGLTPAFSPGVWAVLSDDSSRLAIRFELRGLNQAEACTISLIMHYH